MDANGWSALRLGQAIKASESSIIEALALLTLPSAIQQRVESGELAPSVAYEVSRLDDLESQREVANRVIVEGLNRSETVEVVRQLAEGKSTSKTSAKSKGGRGKTRAKPVTTRIIRTETGPRLTIEWKRGLDSTIIIASLEEAMAKIRSEIEPDQAENDAA